MQVGKSFQKHSDLMESDDKEVISAFEKWANDNNNAVEDNQLSGVEMVRLKTDVENYFILYKEAMINLDNFKDFLAENEDDLASLGIEKTQIDTVINNRIDKFERSRNEMTVYNLYLIDTHENQKEDLDYIVQMLFNLRSEEADNPNF